jgi:hypothetical protein
MSGTRGEFNLVIRCKGCKRENSVDITDKYQSYSSANAGKFQPLAVFECRGLELIECSLQV